MEAEIKAAERAVWAALVTGDAQADRAVLSADFLGVCPGGFSGRDRHSDQLADGPTVAEFDIKQEHLRTLGPDHVLYSYHAAYRRPGQEAWEEMYVSSIWHRTGAGWINIFSQDTPAGDVSPP
ncbi:MAG: nuclear transport factor 2 family protein [Rhodobacteraceae bacterium]|nr:nuclear transport factor 2 family protein [Paracoccaceae bacterium]